MTMITSARIAILATNGFEKSELMVPLNKLRETGATVHVVSPEEGSIRSWDKDDWGESVDVDVKLGSFSMTDYDALVLPGGQINPDILRINPDAVIAVKDFVRSGKTVAAICHAPWILIEAGAAKGRQMTSWPSVKTDLINAGAQWHDKTVVVDNGIITSRNPGDLDAFVDKIIEEVQEGNHAPRELVA